MICGTVQAGTTWIGGIPQHLVRKDTIDSISSRLLTAYKDVGTPHPVECLLKGCAMTDAACVCGAGYSWWVTAPHERCTLP